MSIFTEVTVNPMTKVPDEYSEEETQNPRNWVATKDRGWVRDESVIKCQLCEKKFIKMRRKKHHCRRCGGIYCDACAPKSKGELRKCKKCIEVDEKSDNSKKLLKRYPPVGRAKGDYYIGEYGTVGEVLVAQGEGEMVYYEIYGLKLPQTYKGMFKDGKRNGQGTFYMVHPDSQKDTVYTGKWDGPVVVGKMVGEEGSYEGKLSYFNRTGEGAMKYHDGSIYEGMWNKNTWSGMGKWTPSIAGKTYCAHWYGTVHDETHNERWKESDNNEWLPPPRDDNAYAFGIIIGQSGTIEKHIWKKKDGNEGTFKIIGSADSGSADSGSADSGSADSGSADSGSADFIGGKHKNVVILDSEGKLKYVGGIKGGKYNTNAGVFAYEYYTKPNRCLYVGNFYNGVRSSGGYYFDWENGEINKAFNHNRAQYMVGDIIEFQSNPWSAVEHGMVWGKNHTLANRQGKDEKDISFPSSKVNVSSEPTRCKFGKIGRNDLYWTKEYSFKDGVWNQTRSNGNYTPDIDETELIQGMLIKAKGLKETYKSPMEGGGRRKYTRRVKKRRKTQRKRIKVKRSRVKRSRVKRSRVKRSKVNRKRKPKRRKTKHKSKKR